MRSSTTVLGAGPEGAKIMFVGEQPGHEEDLAGEPFVGPAGRVLDREARRRNMELFVADLKKLAGYLEEKEMPQGDKSKYTDKQKRKAEHIAEGYAKRGTSKGEAKRRAWATVNSESGGGKKSGAGRGRTETPTSSSRGGKAASSRRTTRAAKRSTAARKAAATRKRTTTKRSAAAKRGARKRSRSK